MRQFEYHLHEAKFIHVSLGSSVDILAYESLQQPISVISQENPSPK